MNVLLLTSHAIAEYDDLRMFTDLGYNVYSIGGAYDEVPFEGKRPALPNIVRYPDLEEATNRQRARLSEMNGEPGPVIDWGKGVLAPEVIDWADTIIVHHFPEQWILGQWSTIRRKRVIWRTCGQSDPRLEQVMATLRPDLQVVRYSPAERRAFEPDGWAGEDAVIRFGKYPDDYGPWDGSTAAVGNVTQDMAKRGEACGYERWKRITADLSVLPAGPGSEAIGGVGQLSYEEMVAYLRHIRAYLYLGTIPASYTLGLIEAMMSGVPVVPVEWDVPGIEWLWLARLWEANEIVPWMDRFGHQEATHYLRDLLHNREWAELRGAECRERAIELFGIDTIAAQWAEFLG